MVNKYSEYNRKAAVNRKLLIFLAIAIAVIVVAAYSQTIRNHNSSGSNVQNSLEANPLPDSGLDIEEFITADEKYFLIKDAEKAGIKTERWQSENIGLTKTNYRFTNNLQEQKITFGWKSRIGEEYKSANNNLLSDDFETSELSIILNGSQLYILDFSDIKAAFGGVRITYKSNSRTLTAESAQKIIATGESIIVDPTGGKWGRGTGVQDANVSACGTINSQGINTLQNNVNASGTCLEINISNVIVDCAGYQINYSQSTSGYGINNSPGLFNITVRNCFINQLSTNDSSYAIYYKNSTNGTIANNTITTKAGTAYGLQLDAASHYNNISGNRITATNASAAAVLINSSENNTIYNNILNSSSSKFVNITGTISFNNWNISKTSATNIISGQFIAGNYYINTTGGGFSTTCNETNGDGICEETLTHATSNTDFMVLSLNSAPVINSINVTPATAYRTSQLNCSFNVTDANTGNTIAVNITWFNSSNRYTTSDFRYSSVTRNVLYNNGNGSIAENITRKNELWKCNVTAEDATTQTSNSSANITIQNSVPVLSSPANTPSGGNTSTIFNFTVTYSDVDSDEPGFVNLSIDSTRYVVTKNDSASVLTGRKFWYETNVTSGAHTFYFNASDGTSTVNSSTVSGLQINETTPALIYVLNYSMTTTTAVINYTTNVSANGTASYGNTTALGSLAYNSTYGLYGEIRLSNLIRSTVYYYNITLCTITGLCSINGSFSFRTNDTSFSGSNVTSSNTTNSDLLNSTIINATIDYSNVNFSIVINSTINGTTVFNSSINSSYANSSNIAASGVVNSSATNSTVLNSLLTLSSLFNSTMRNGTLYNVTANNSQLYNSSFNTTILTNVITNSSSVSESSTLRDSTILSSAVRNSTKINTTITRFTSVRSRFENSVGENSTSDSCTARSSTVNNSLLNISGSFACDISGSRVEESQIRGGVIRNSTIDPSTIVESTITNSTIINSTIRYSTIENANIQNMDVFTAGVSFDTLTSGRIIYNNKSFYAPYSISNIYAGIEPSPQGTLAVNKTPIRNGESITITYAATGTGYKVRLNVSAVGGGAAIDINDSGVSPDILKDDGVHTVVISSISASEPNAVVYVNVNDTVGNFWRVNLTITVDNTAPAIAEVAITYPRTAEARAGDTITIRSTITDAASAIVDCSNFGAGAKQMTKQAVTGGTVNFTEQCTLLTAQGNATIAVNTTDTAGNTAQSTAVVVIDNSTPTAPTSLFVRDTPYDTDGTVTLEWTKSVSDDVIAYNIYRGQGSGFAITAGNLVKNVSSTANTTTETLPGGRYYWVITAVDNVMYESSAGNEVSTNITSSSPTITNVQVIYPSDQTTTQTAAKNNDNVKVTAQITSDIGIRNATINATATNGSSAEQMRDDGQSGDATASDNVYTGQTTINGTSGDYNATVSIRATDNSGVNTTRNVTIAIDNTKPNGSITIQNTAPLNQTNPEYTNTRSVILLTNWSDGTSGIASCQFANEDAVFGAKEACTNTKSWMLTDGDVNKTVYMRAWDKAGNNITVNDTIVLNKTGAGLDTTPPSAPVVSDEGVYTNRNTTLRFSWTGAYDRESDLLHLPLNYEFRLYDITNGSFVNVSGSTNWQSIGANTSLTLTSLALANSRNYTLRVRAINSAGMNSSDASSDGIIVDVDVPNAPTVTSATHTNQSKWTAANQPEFAFNSSDATSQIESFSYVFDTNNVTVPDDISENGINVTFAAVADGILYFHVKAKDNASNWGGVTHYRILADITKPSTPQMNATQSTNTTNITLSWTASSDISGINEYYLEVGTSLDGNNTFAASIGNVTSYGVTVSQPGTYYARVKARNGADLWSDWSSGAPAVSDTASPGITFKKPNASVSSTTVILTVETDENAICSQKRGVFAYVNFTLTGNKFHETKVFVENYSQSYTFDIRCVDSVGNTNTTNVTFTPVTTAADTVAITSNISAFTGQIVSLNFTVTTSGAGLGEIGSSAMQLRVNGLISNDASFRDLGNGKYTVKFTTPDTSGTYTFRAVAGSAYGETSGSVNGLALTVSLQDSNGSITKQKTIYKTNSDIAFGLASDSQTLVLNTSNNKMAIGTNPDEAIGQEIYLILTKPNAPIDRADEKLKKNTFDRALKPSFGYGNSEESVVQLIVQPSDTTIIGSGQLASGRHQLIIRNLGFNTTINKTIIEIRRT